MVKNLTFIEDTQLLQVLRGFNPWWIVGEVPATLAKPVRRLAFYEISNFLQRTDFHRAILVSGARRVGKTTILYQLAQEAIREGMKPSQIMYASFDHPILKLASLERIIEVFRNNVAGGAELLLFFDEVHYAPDWNLWLKLTVDRYPNYKIVATGSASSILDVQGAESGVGRWIEIKIPTLSFYEYLELLGLPRPDFPRDIKPTQIHNLSRPEAQDVLNKCLPLEPHFHRYLLVGGFPETALMQDTLSAQRLLREDVVDKVLKRDMTALYGVRNVLDLERLFIYLCMHTGQILVQDTIAKEIGVSRVTVSNDLKYLEMANLIYRSEPTDLEGKRILKAKPKVYLADPAIRNAVLLKGDEVLADPIEMGIIVETAVFKHLAAFYFKERPRIGYWRETKTNKEVDIVVELPNTNSIIAEIKYREDPSISAQEGIISFIRSRKVASALLVTKTSRDFGAVELSALRDLPVKPFRIPAFVFLYLLGHAEHAAFIR
ncbi:MAG: ATP-binding protein [Syntrophothermus sp.]